MLSKSLFSKRRALLLLVVLLVTWVAPSAVVLAQAPSTDIERFGVGVWGDIGPYDIGPLNIHWYVNWSMSPNPPRPYGADFAQMVRVRVDDPARPDDVGYWPPDWNVLEQIVLANRGSLWLIGNEPDHMDQDNCLPQEYADRYHALYQFIKQRDPTAQVAAGGLTQATPLRLHWLSEVIAAYQATYGQPMPVDAWQIHEQILCETCGNWVNDVWYGWGVSCPPGMRDYQYTEGRWYEPEDAVDIAVFMEHIGRMRTWMANNGYRNVPLILSEFGVLQPSGCGFLGVGAPDPYAAGNQMVKDFMTASFNYLLQATDPTIGYPADGNRLVQQWAWYSLNAPMSTADCSYINSANGSLYYTNNPSQLTEFGYHYKQYTDALVPGAAPPCPATDADGDCVADIIVWRPSNGRWYILYSSTGFSYAAAASFTWGQAGDVPVPGDVDGDGKMDLISWRPSDGKWRVAYSTTGYGTMGQYGWGASGDIPLNGDADGDGLMDIIVWRPSKGRWYILYSSTGFSYAAAASFTWGQAGDVPVPGDVDGDGKMDLISWRPSDGKWRVAYSTTGYGTMGQYGWGASGDIPLPRHPTDH